MVSKPLLLSDLELNWVSPSSPFKLVRFFCLSDFLLDSRLQHMLDALWWSSWKTSSPSVYIFFSALLTATVSITPMISHKIYFTKTNKLNSYKKQLSWKFLFEKSSFVVCIILIRWDIYIEMFSVNISILYLHAISFRCRKLNTIFRLLLQHSKHMRRRKT